MRELTESERKLWEDFTNGVKLQSSDIVPDSKPAIRPQVQDISFRSVLDLHNFTIQAAYDASNAHIEEAFYLGITKIQHITGKSGQISQEFETWASLHPRIRKIKKQNDGGAWLLWLKRK
jgi:hypothetical protein